MKGKAGVVTAMLIFGSIGLFVRGIPLPSSAVALCRGTVGCLVLLAAGWLLRREISWKAMRGQRWKLLLSGAAIGFNWIFLFEAYKFTTVSRATLSYYFAPVFVLLLSPWILKERLTAGKLVCAAGATAGMALVSGVWTGGLGAQDLIGIGLGLSAAMLYACVMLTNQHIHGLSGIELTVAQLLTASLVLLPYTLLTVGDWDFPMTPGAWLLLAAVGVVHTGIAYLLYFSGMQKLRGQTVAVLSYIDPVTAIALSALFLGERMDGSQAVGAALVLGMTLYISFHDVV